MKSTVFWRYLLLVLLLVNLSFWVWSQGHLRLFGLGPATVTEPERMRQQIAPEALTLGRGVEAAPAESAEPVEPAASAASEASR